LAQNGISEEKKQTPLFQSHGDEDTVVFLPKGQNANKVLAEGGVKYVNFKVYPTLSHSTSTGVIQDFEAFLAKVLP
jgi:predicted esterase